MRATTIRMIITLAVTATCSSFQSPILGATAHGGITAIGHGGITTDVLLVVITGGTGGGTRAGVVGITTAVAKTTRVMGMEVEETVGLLLHRRRRIIAREKLPQIQ